MAPEVAGHQLPRTLAVVLNYRTPDATIHAVKSLQASTRPPASVIVVDNASGDGSREGIQAAARGVDVIALASNDGFSAGCNAGIRAALARGASRVFVMNSDVDMPSGTLAKLEQVFDREPRVGVAAPIVMRRHAPDSVESAGIS
jgi:GT2 family glycosyltransferase